MPVRQIVLLVIAVAAVSLGASTLTAHDGDHGPSQSQIDAIKVNLRNADTSLSTIQSMLNQLTGQQAADANTPLGQMARSMQTMLSELLDLHSVTGRAVEDPGVHDAGPAMAALQSASKDLERMTSAFQSLTKNVSRIS